MSSMDAMSMIHKKSIYNGPMEEVRPGGLGAHGEPQRAHQEDRKKSKPNDRRGRKTNDIKQVHVNPSTQHPGGHARGS